MFTTVKHSKLWEIYTLISPLYFILSPKLLPYFIPFLNSHILDRIVVLRP